MAKSPTTGTPEDDSTPTHSDQKAQPKDKDTPVNNKSDGRTLQPTQEQKEANSKAYETQDYYPPGWTRSEKMSKETAEYKKGTPFHTCGGCTYYQSSHCKIVRGYISPEMSCLYHQEKYDPDRFKSIMIKRMR
jgi:hypothetical protein